jgi:DNA-binding NtrC family response regulator
VRPVGGHEALKVDVRIIAASNQDLKELIRLGRFREDLFYRLNVVTIRIPPLRERREDIPALVETFLERSATRTGQEKRTIGKEAMKVLLNYDWPGNVRELESTVTTASLFALTSEIQTGDLANKPELMESAAPRPLTDLGERSLDDLEREAIIQALVRTKGNKMAAAKVLGISRRSLYNKLTQYDIQLTRKTTILR